MIIALEGNIGAGKTSILQELRYNQNYKGLLDDYFCEPVERYCIFKISGPLALMEQRYHNPLLNLYMFPSTDTAIAQLHFMRSSYNYFWPKFQEDSPQKLMLCERAYPSTRCFIELYRRKLFFTPFVHDFLLDEFRPGSLVPDFSIHLDVPADVCLKRVRQRQRFGEQNIDLATLELFREIMSETMYFPNYEIINLAVEGNESVAQVAKKVAEIIKRIKNDIALKKIVPLDPEHHDKYQ